MFLVHKNIHASCSDVSTCFLQQECSIFKNHALLIVGLVTMCLPTTSRVPALQLGIPRHVSMGVHLVVPQAILYCMDMDTTGQSLAVPTNDRLLVSYSYHM